VGPAEGMISFAGYPLIVGERLVGVMALFARHPLNEATLQAMASVANSIALGIERKRGEAEMREQAEIIETVNRLGQTLAAELDLHKLVQAVTDAATEITGASFGSFFYNVLDEAGASYMLYTLSGVPRSAFEHFPMPRATDLFGPTFRGEGTVCIDDVKLDPRYGKNSPYYGMPEGHLPVTSYLAVPVVSRSGEVYGGLFFGHPEAGVFTEREARIIEGIAAQASVAMDNAKLFEAAQRSRAEAEQSAAENARLYREAQESSRLKDEFLATVSHELRTPLTAILGWAHMLRTGQVNGDSAAKAFETIERNARAQSQLIDDLLDVSRIITGKLRIDVRPVDPNSFVEAAVEAVRPAAEAKGIRVQKIMDTGVVSVSGDPVRLQQVIWNLLSNSIKFTPKGGRVQVRLERVNSHIEVTVSDTGAGIVPEFLPHVFDRFRQADGRTTRQHGGWGWDSPSFGTWWRCTAGLSGPRARVRDRVQPSRCCCPSRPSIRLWARANACIRRRATPCPLSTAATGWTGLKSSWWTTSRTRASSSRRDSRSAGRRSWRPARRPRRLRRCGRPGPTCSSATSGCRR
jgi:GAF domain-containing protein